MRVRSFSGAVDKAKIEYVAQSGVGGVKTTHLALTLRQTTALPVLHDAG